MDGSFAARTRQRLREEILAAAAAEVVARGWRGLRMQAVAVSVGVSRQTVHNEFSSKQRLARALVLAIAARYCDSYEQIIEASPDVRSALRDTVGKGLEGVARDAVFKALLTPDGSDTFLPLYTNEAAPLVELFNTRLTTAWRKRWPGIDPERLRIVIDAGTRLVLSHILLPTSPPEQVSEEFAALFGSFLVGQPRGA